QRGAALLDMRSKAEYMALHVAGAVHMEADDQLSNRIGFVLSADMPIVLMLNDLADYRRVVYSLARVGYDNVVGYLAEGLNVWQAMGLPVMSGDVQDIDPRDLFALLETNDKLVVVDVREPWEFAQGHVPHAKLIPL